MAHGLPLLFDPAVSAIPAAPLEIHHAEVPAEWIDYNGHMNVAYYVMAFDQATDSFFDLVGLGVEYAEQTSNSAFVLENHVNFRQEVAQGDPLRFTLQLLDADQKRLHLYLEMFHADEGYLSATLEQLIVHVDLEARKSAQFPQDLQARIDAVLASHSSLPMPDLAGGKIALRR